MKMKRFFVIASIFCALSFGLLSSGSAWENPGKPPVFCLSSGEVTTSPVTIYDGTCYVVSVLVITDGTNNAKLVLTAGGAAGTVQFETTVVGADNYGGRVWTLPVQFLTDCYGVLSGTGASYIVEYVK